MRKWYFFVLALLLCPLAAQAQVTTSLMRGSVVDADGNDLPGANILATHQPSGSEYGATTNIDGQFVIPNMRVGGPYTLRVTFVGFEPYTESNIQLKLGEAYRVRVVLNEGDMELQGVEVVAESGVFNANQTGNSTSIGEDVIDRTPTVGRDIADFTRLTPQAYVSNDDDDGPTISVAGQNNRYNSIFVDGAVSNDVFGLSAQGTDGGQTGATPISIDAIEEFQVNISPYDVSQSGFTGAAINAVTRSGSNNFEGSVAYFRRGDELTQDAADFGNNRYVARLGGPIVQDKLFFFLNADFLRSNTPQPAVAAGDYRGATSFQQAQDLRQFMIDNVGYDPGNPLDKTAELNSDKLLAKLDWNIAQGHKLSARYNYTGSDNIDMFRTDSDEIYFSNTGEVFPNDTHSGTVELNSFFGDNLSNKFLVSYKSVLDDRGVSGTPFPWVEIDDAGGDIIMGGELFSGANLLGQDVLTVTDNLNWFVGEHTLTAGMHHEFYSIENMFTIFNYGNYSFFSLDDFKQTVCAASDTPTAECDQYRDENGALNPATSLLLRGYSLADDDPNTSEFEEVVGDDSDAIAAFDAYQLGFYLQDEWQVSDRVRLSGGLRVDIPKVTTEPDYADDYFTATEPLLEQYHTLDGAEPGQTPAANLHWSPRFGFNIDAFGDQRLQLRGGTGVFTSRVPFVWPGGMFANNGVRAGFLASFGENELRTDVSDAINPSDVGQPAVSPSGRLEMFEDGFMYPRVWRSSLGFDYRLPMGFIATIEGQYTNTLSNITVKNVGLKPSNATISDPSNRPIWAYGVEMDSETGMITSIDQDAALIDARYDNIHRVGNTSEGYTYDVTTRLRKDWGNVASMNLSYTYGDAFSINDGTSSQINSIWQYPENKYGSNNLELARSDFSLGHRVLASFTYRREFLDNLATTMTLTYTGESGRPFSYIVNSEGAEYDMIGQNGDEESALFYVPSSVGEYRFADIVRDGEVVRSAAQQRADVARFIDNNEYLSSRNGNWSERNGDRTPWENIVDLSLRQEIFGDLLGRRQKLSVSLDVFNFTSLLGDLVGTDWGKRYYGINSFEVMQFQHFEDPNPEDGVTEFVPVYQSNLGTSDDSVVKSEEDIFDTIESGTTYGSQWIMQLGVRYTF